MNTDAIEKRYAILATDNCCLSCGSAIYYANVKPGETCVDLGSGRGTDVMRLAHETGEKGFVYGIDVTEKMIQAAKKTAEKLSVNNVGFIRSEFENIPLDDSSVDLVLSNCSLNHAQNKAKVWMEIARVLQPGGRFVISDIYSMEEVPEEFATDVVAISECWAGAVTKEKYLEQIDQAGLSGLEIMEESKPYAKGKIEVCSFTIKGKLE